MARSRNGPRSAVALNCGIGSSCLNEPVNAFYRLQSVRGRELLDRGVEVEIVNPPREMLWHIELALNEGAIDDELRRLMGELGLFPGLHCLRIGSKLRCIRSTPTDYRVLYVLRGPA